MPMSLTLPATPSLAIGLVRIAIQLLNEDGVTAMTGAGSHPIDFTATPDGRFLYVLLPGTSQVGMYGINQDGSLTQQGAAQGEWPIGLQGIVAY